MAFEAALTLGAGRADLKRWEVSKNKVVFYFDSLDGRRRCLEMVVQREQEVEDVKPARATVYDYYQAEVALSTVSSVHTHPALLERGCRTVKLTVVAQSLITPRNAYLHLRIDQLSLKGPDMLRNVISAIEVPALYYLIMS